MDELILLDTLDPGILGIIGSYLDVSDTLKLIEMLGLKDEQTFYASLLSNKLGHISIKLIGNQKAYFDIWTYFDSIKNMLSAWAHAYESNPIYNNLKILYDIHPEEFKRIIKYINTIHVNRIHSVIIVAIVDDLEIIKYLFDDLETQCEPKYSRVSLELRKRDLSKYMNRIIEEKERLRVYVPQNEFDESNDIKDLIYYLENIRVNYVKHIIDMMEFYNIK